MGSSGTNSFSDYPGSTGGTRTPGNGAGGGGIGGGATGCEQPVLTHLEEVASCEYYGTNGRVPAPATPVSVRTALVSGRLGVQDDSGTLIGYLPTSFNYLLQCIGQGFSYSGQVTSADVRPVPSVHVSLAGAV